MKKYLILLFIVVAATTVNSQQVAATFTAGMYGETNPTQTLIGWTPGITTDGYDIGYDSENFGVNDPVFFASVGPGYEYKIQSIEPVPGGSVRYVPLVIKVDSTGFYMIEVNNVVGLTGTVEIWDSLDLFGGNSIGMDLDSGIVYENRFYAVFTNEAETPNGIEDILSGLEVPDDNRIFDLSGRLIGTTDNKDKLFLKPGIYIINRKTVYIGR